MKKYISQSLRRAKKILEQPNNAVFQLHSVLNSHFLYDVECFKIFIQTVEQNVENLSESPNQEPRKSSSGKVSYHFHITHAQCISIRYFLKEYTVLVPLQKCNS